jgi:hypothetical protein
MNQQPGAKGDATLNQERMNPADDTLRFAFDGEVIPTAPIHLSFPDRGDKSEPPMIIMNGTKHYMVTGTSVRGGLRRYAAKNILRKQRQQHNDGSIAFTSETARVLMIGGVKGSDDSAHLTPLQIQKIREKNPQLDVFGMGDPLMMRGTFLCGFMVSDEEVYRRIHFNAEAVEPATTLPIIRRSLLRDGSLSVGDIADPETMMDDAKANRRRSQIANAIKTWGRLDRKQSKREQLTTRDMTNLTEAKDILKRETGEDFKTVADAQHHLETVVIPAMRAAGQKDVSEQNLQSVSFIPAGTVLRHRMELHHTTRAGVGLFLWAWHDKYMFDPVIGGMAARGCGGYCTMRYLVRRQHGYDWVNDCTMIVEPDKGVTFENADNSELKACFQEWQSADIRKYSFDFEYLRKLIANGDAE